MAYSNYQDLYKQMATAAPAPNPYANPNPYAMALRTTPMAQPATIYRPQQQKQGNDITSIAAKIAKKYFAGGSDAGGGSFAAGPGGGPFAAKGAFTNTGGGALTAFGGPGAPVTGGASVATGGSAAIGPGGSFTAGSAGNAAGAGTLGTAGMAALPIVIPLAAKAFGPGGGNPNIAKALRDFKTGTADPGPKGLQMTEYGGWTFIEGDEQAVDLAWSQAMDEGKQASLIRPGLLSIKGSKGDIEPILASNSPGIDTNLFGYLG